jgi:hypothetical protein
MYVCSRRGVLWACQHLPSSLPTAGVLVFIEDVQRLDGAHGSGSGHLPAMRETRSAINVMRRACKPGPRIEVRLELVGQTLRGAIQMTAGADGATGREVTEKGRRASTRGPCLSPTPVFPLYFSGALTFCPLPKRFQSTAPHPTHSSGSVPHPRGP